MGHVQDTPVSTKMILNECMIYHMKVRIVSYNLGQKKVSKSRIHILPNYGQKDSKMAIVTYVFIYGKLAVLWHILFLNIISQLNNRFLSLPRNLAPGNSPKN